MCHSPGLPVGAGVRPDRGGPAASPGVRLSRRAPGHVVVQSIGATHGRGGPYSATWRWSKPTPQQNLATLVVRHLEPGRWRSGIDSLESYISVVCRELIAQRLSRRHDRHPGPYPKRWRRFWRRLPNNRWKRPRRLGDIRSLWREVTFDSWPERSAWSLRKTMWSSEPTDCRSGR